MSNGYPTALLVGEGCPNDTVDVVTAGGFSTAWQYLFKGEHKKPKALSSALATANNQSAVLLAHSYGGPVGFAAFLGELFRPHSRFLAP